MKYQCCCYGYPSSSVQSETVETIHRLRDLSSNPKCSFSSRADGEQAVRAVNEVTSPVAVPHSWLHPSQSRFVSTFCVSLQWPVSVMSVYLYWFHTTRSISHTAWLFVSFFASRISCQQMSNWNCDSGATPTCTPTSFTLELPSMVELKYSNSCEFLTNSTNIDLLEISCLLCPWRECPCSVPTVHDRTWFCWLLQHQIRCLVILKQEEFCN